MGNPQVIHTAAGEELVVLPRSEYEALLARANDVSDDAEDVSIHAAHDAEFATSNATVLPKEVSAAILRGDSRLKAIRRWKDVTQLDLSRKTGISQGYLSDLENGHRAGTPETIAKLAEALDIPVEWFSWPEPTEYASGPHRKAGSEHRTARRETSLGSRGGLNPSAFPNRLGGVLRT